MTVTEQARHRLHGHLEEIMGEEHAAALMEWLPDGPLASKDDVERVRTELKQDIAHLREVMDVRFEAVDHRFEAIHHEMRSGFDALRAEFQRELRVQTFVTIGGVATLAGVAATMARMF